MEQEMMREQPSKSACEVIGAVISVGVSGFWSRFRR